MAPLPLPIIDFSNFTTSPETKASVARDLTAACRETGFVYITNHRVAPELVEEAFQWSQRLFALKMEEKMLAPHPDGAKVHRGYSWPGLEKVSQYMGSNGTNGAGNEADEVEKLRKVRDCKVCLFSLH